MLDIFNVRAALTVLIYPANYYSSEGLNFQKDEGLVGFEDQERIQKSKLNPGRPVDMMHYFDEDERIAMINKAAPFYLPVWQTSPVLETGFINEDQMQPHGVLAPQPETVSIVLDNATAVIGGFTSARPGSIHSSDKRTALFATLRSMAEKKEGTFEVYKNNMRNFLSLL